MPSHNMAQSQLHEQIRRQHPPPQLKRRRFFKVLLDDFQNRLLIPNGFVEDLCKEDDPIPENLEAKIRVGGRYCWRVKVKIIKDAGIGHFFGDGWGEMVRSCDLQFGYFLLFDQKDRMIFDLTIFDLSGCSKTYFEEPKSVYCSPVKQRSLGEVKQVRIPTIVDMVDDEDYKGRKEDYKRKRALMGKTPSESPKKEHQTKNSTSLIRSNFQSTITSAHLLGRNRLSIPRSFDSQKYLEDTPFVILRFNGREPSWRVTIHRERARPTIFRFGGGFKRFCHGNNVEEGDVCQFHLETWKKTDLEVTIHVNILKKSSIEKSNDCVFPPVCDSSGLQQHALGENMMKSTASRSPKKRYKKGSSRPLRRSMFIKTLSLRHLLGNSQLLIPSSFDSPKYLNGKSFVRLKIDGKGRSWRVGISHDRKLFLLGRGFVKFCHENNLKEGCVCQFQIIDWKKAAPELTIKVLVLEAKGEKA